MKSSKRSSKQPKIKWLERRLMLGPHLVLCLTEAEYHKALDHLKIPMEDRHKWLASYGEVHTFENDEGMVCIVCIALKTIRSKPASEVARILVHEAVHVWQQYSKDIGEKEPSSEFEAYSIEAIFTVLFTEALKRRAASL